MSICKEFVQDRLKAPATADFPGDEQQYEILDEEGGRYDVAGKLTPRTASARKCGPSTCVGCGSIAKIGPSSTPGQCSVSRGTQGTTVLKAASAPPEILSR